MSPAGGGDELLDLSGDGGGGDCDESDGGDVVGELASAIYINDIYNE